MVTPVQKGASPLRPRARIIKTIGEELISNDIVAVLELVKNSYDADSPIIEIIFSGDLDKRGANLTIKDKGTGMTLDTIKNAWFEPATNFKKLLRKTKKGRRILGEKGIGSAAELERDLIKERVKLGMQGRAAEHKWLNKTPPLGYDRTNEGYLRINKDKAQLVKDIFKLYLSLKSMPEVAFSLNKRGIKTERGNQWSATAVKRILDNELYIGMYKVMDVEDYVENYKIINNKLFNKAKNLRLRSKKHRSPMPISRKQGTIDKVFNEYLSLLETSETTQKSWII